MNKLEKLLTPRELQVLKHLITGNSGYVIAYDLSVTESTIKVLTTHIFRKLKITNKTQLTSLVYRNTIEEIASGSEFPQRKAKLFLEWLEDK